MCYCYCLYLVEILIFLHFQAFPRVDIRGNPTFPRSLHRCRAVDSWPEAPDVVSVDPERREDVGLVEEISQHSGGSQQVLNSHHLGFNNDVIKYT